MPYKDKEKAKEYWKQKKRQQRLSNPDDVQPVNVQPYHPVLKYLIPGPDRDKMEKIVESVKRHNQLRNVYLGCGVHSLSLDIVGEMLEVT